MVKQPQQLSLSKQPSLTKQPSPKPSRSFNGMAYRAVQQSNTNRRSKLPAQDRQQLKEQGYKNTGWEQVIRLYQKIEQLLTPPDDEPTLEDLFLEADRIGNPYLTPEERAAYQQELAQLTEDISEVIDQQFPDTEMEVLDFTVPTPKTRKRR